MLLGAGCFFSYGQLQFLSILLCVEAALGHFSPWRQTCSTNFLELLCFHTLIILLVLEKQVCCSWQPVSCQLCFLHAGVMPCTTVIFHVVYDMQWFKKKKAKPNQNTTSNHHHIYNLVCITSCSNCIRFHWVIFNHFPSKAYKEFSSVGSFQPGSLLPLQDACVIQILQSGRCSETSCAVQVSKNFLTHLLKVLPPFLPPFKFLMLPCYLPLEFCCWGL